MKLEAGKVAVVTGAASGIGLALSERFAASGMHVVLADVDEAALSASAAKVSARGVEAFAVRTDVSDEASVQALAAAAVERFGTVHVVCNNAGVMSSADPWFGPLSTWTWLLGVNLWGVIHGVRAFLPVLATQAEGHIVNTASIAGLYPGFGAAYDATKHAVVAITDDLYTSMRQAGLPIGVSVLCPGWVRTNLLDADRNWPTGLGDEPPPALGADIVLGHVRRVIDEGMPPAAVADLVADAVEAERFWVLPHPEFVELAVQRWHDIAEGINPRIDVEVPGLPSAAQIAEEVIASLQPPEAS
jgi:NAD(P)-dependent dehydrogenase (short-subunit alcohol dehydrogenase family)